MIGTITFHWCTNYGAVIQSYALQYYLLSKGYKTEIINYIPRRIALIHQYQAIRKRDILTIKKQKAIMKFRKQRLKTTKRIFGKFKSLYSVSDRYSHIIVGSDQVWNESFTLGAEKKITLSYFLAFAGNNTKRISYATSFGTDSVSKKYVDAVKKEIQKFSAVSVRENTGINICNELGVSAALVCDPTLLLKESDYLKLLEQSNFSAKTVFGYILHDNQKNAWSVYDSVKRIIGDSESYHSAVSIEEWLYNIKYSKLVVTNSFHGVVFSLIFHTNFIVIPVEGSKMNDRIKTIIDFVGLSYRIIDESNECRIKTICETEIDWDYVDHKIAIIRQSSEDFLLNSLK